ncbi:glycoside hydrolase family 3 N-terminal domain-containing protein [Bifidobacterium vespertilionis]
MKHVKRMAIEDLSLAERAALLAGASQWTTRAVPRAGVPPMVMSDGPHGLRHEVVRPAAQPAAPAAPTAPGASLPATCFPTAATVACSWDPELASRMGATIAQEARAQGVDVLLGPGLNIKRSPRCGRNFEYYSEDPVLAGRMGAEFIRGVQLQGVAACPKHFAVNGQELRRQSSNSVVDERTMRELYLTAFEIAVREGRPWAIMSSYNRVNGVYAHENRHLLTEILRDEWGFDGMVVSDWGASNSAVRAVAAGGSLEMPCPGLASVREVMRAVEDGRLAEADVTARAREVALCAARTHGGAAHGDRTGSMPLIGFAGAASGAGAAASPNPPASPDPAAAHEAPAGVLPPDMIDAHHRVARDVAEQSMVLLRNKPIASMGARAGKPVLPLPAGTRVALVGDMAARPRFQGSGSSKVNATRVDALIGALAAEGGLALAGYAPGYRHDGTPSRELVDRAVAVAVRGDVDAVVACVGLDERSEAEGLDRSTLAMPAPQLDLMAALAKACGKADKPLIAVLTAGSPVLLPWADDCDAILYAGLGGQAGASAVARILSGKTNPSGRLAETWPLGECDGVYGEPNVPEGPGKPGASAVAPASAYPCPDRDVVYREGSLVGYRYWTTAGLPVRFPFGHGLTYTRFDYADLEVGQTGVSFTLTNVGDRPGAEVAQLYVTGPCGSAGGDPASDGPARVALELKGFAKVRLDPGESTRVTIPFDRYTFRHWDEASGSWQVESGPWRVTIGSDCLTPRLSATHMVRGTMGARLGGSGDLSGQGDLDSPGIPAVLGVPGMAGDPAAADADHRCRLAAVRAETARALADVASMGDGIVSVAPAPIVSTAPVVSTMPIVSAVTPQSAKSRVFDANDPFSSWNGSRDPIARWWAHRLARDERRARERRGEPDLDALFRLNMPPRALAKLSGGRVDARAARSLARIPNGHPVLGLIGFAVGVLRNQAANRRTAALLGRFGLK